MIKPPIQGPYYPVSIFVFISRVHTIRFQASQSRVHTIQRSFTLGIDVELCHSPPEGGSISSMYMVRIRILASFGGVQAEDVSTQLRYTRLNLRPLSGWMEAVYSTDGIETVRLHA